MLYEVIPTKLFRSGGNFLTYSSDFPLKPGHIVIIPLGKDLVTGIVYRSSTEKVTFKTKKVEKLLYKTPLPPHLIKALLWLSEYYLLPLPSVAPLFLPQGIEKNRRFRLQETLENYAILPEIPLNPAQKQALKAISSVEEATKLLHGVTGSGKTNIYLKMASECLRKKKSAIILVPEIALTSQLVKIFESIFGAHVTLIHSRQSEAERHKIWENLLLSKDPQIILGPRSALFAPVKNLGLIIIDEAHESAYYQENSPKYSSLRLASFIANSEKITCLLGTATPLISDYYVANLKNSLIPLKTKAKSTAITPEIKIIDLKEKENFKKNRYFSDALLETIKNNLKNHRQTLIFHNRRGSSSMTLCEQCGWQALCPSCFLPLTLHSDSFSLTCHTCGHTEKIPHVCPECHSSNIIHKGFGTKLLESELKKLFKTAKIARFDADNKKGETLNSLYNEVKTGDIDILIGTQTLARGLDLPLLASVGIVQADSGFSLPDYSAEEKTFHLLTQVIGRVGRGHLDTASVIIQTFQPDNPIIKYATTSDYDKFYSYLSKKRKQQKFPPFVFLAKVSVSMKTEKTTIKKIQTIYQFLSENAGKSIQIGHPTPSFHERTSTNFTWQITLKSTSRKALLNLLSSVDPKLKPNIALDPPSLL